MEELEKRGLTQDERDEAIRLALPLKSLGIVVETRTNEQAILVLRPEQTGDLWAFSGHYLDLIESLRRSADDLEKLYQS